MSKFYEEECLPRVQSIARDLDFLCENAVDQDELEKQIEQIETEWQDELWEASEGFDAYELTGEDLIQAMTDQGIEIDAEEYRELCEQLARIESIGAADLYEYFDVFLDLEYTVSSSGEYLGACIWITVGGPGIWVDTREQTVNLAWGRERVSWSISSETANEIDTIFEEQYNCIR